MRIILLRHGKPNLSSTKRINSTEFGKWISQCNTAKLNLKYQPNIRTVEVVKKANKYVCSNLSRSTESANILGVSKIDCIESYFREAELPYIKIPLLKLFPETWAIIFRILWFFGLKTNGESLLEAKNRASTGADKLRKLANSDGSVVFIGHGFMNRFIAKELLSNGWQNSTPLSDKYWEFGVYEYLTNLR